MSVVVDYLSNKASEAEIAEHLLRCDTDFVPRLSGRVEIMDYAQKIANKATTFEAWSGGTLIGLAAAYCNHQENRIAYITSVSVLKDWTCKGIAAVLVDRCIDHAQVYGMWLIRLEVAADNTPALKLYKGCGFVEDKANGPFVGMNLCLKNGEEYEQQT